MLKIKIEIKIIFEEIKFKNLIMAFLINLRIQHKF